MVELEVDGGADVLEHLQHGVHLKKVKTFA
jgi:hypothetical protein